MLHQHGLLIAGERKHPIFRPIQRHNQSVAPGVCGDALKHQLREFAQRRADDEPRHRQFEFKSFFKLSLQLNRHDGIQTKIYDRLIDIHLFGAHTEYVRQLQSQILKQHGFALVCLGGKDILASNRLLFLMSIEINIFGQLFRQSFIKLFFFVRNFYQPHPFQCVINFIGLSDQIYIAD